MDSWHMKPNRFEGSLGIAGHSYPVAFTAAIDRTGEVKLQFEQIPITAGSAFIQDCWEGTGTDFGVFSLVGTAADEASFATDSLIFSALGVHSIPTRASMMPSASVSNANFRLRIDDTESSAFKVLLKGFYGRRKLSIDTRLGKLEMVGSSGDEDVNIIRGAIQIIPPSGRLDLGVWKADVENFLEHVRHVMSFSASAMLGAPVSEFIHDGEVHIATFSQARQTKSSMEPFKSDDQFNIFKCSVTSYFEPAIDFKNIKFAIEWFAMESTYAEVGLINAMTVLENMLSSNLSEQEKVIQADVNFTELKKKLSAALKIHSTELFGSTAEQSQFRASINEKFGDLNRKSLKQKMDTLASRWRVNLEGLDEKKIKEAKRARDLIVHEGSYEYRVGENAPLFDHLLVARELVVRFILTALRFEGSYYSYIGGWHPEDFMLAQLPNPELVPER